MSGFVGCIVATFCLIILALSITSIVLSQDDNDCNKKDDMGLAVSDYLLGSGISGIIAVVMLIFSGLLQSQGFGVFCVFLYALFATAWHNGWLYCRMPQLSWAF